MVGIPVSLNIEEAKSKLQAADWQQIQDLLEVADPLISAQAVCEAFYVR